MTVREAKTKNSEVVRSEEHRFSEIAQLIEAARESTLRTVNTALIDLYWQIGQTLSRRIEAAEWGEGVIDRLAEYLARTQPGLRGFTRANLFRMRQFFETYRDEEKVVPLVRQLPWTHNLLIMGQSKRPEEREFYLRVSELRVEALAVADLPGTAGFEIERLCTGVRQPLPQVFRNELRAVV